MESRKMTRTRMRSRRMCSQRLGFVGENGDKSDET
jgi:hypothetical protein